MLLRLPSPIRASVVTPHRRYSSAIASSRTSEPLRILFCGSDDFSIASLRALVQAKRDEPTLIDSIHVLHRPAKPTGRGLKTLREVPIKHAAAPTDLSLPTHAVDTFTGWTPPPSINLIIAVSFGLFVPPRILNQAKYGGLNVHPSLLPDLPGPAPIEHAILKGRRTTGITIQTLDPEHFDQGTILAQSSVPVRHDHTAAELHKQLETAGAKELVHVLQTRKFVPPLDDARLPSGSGPMEYARKLTKQDRFIDLAKSTLGEILAITRALGPPWCFLPNGRRLQLLEIQHVKEMNGEHDAPGFFVDKDTRQIVMRAACGSVARLVKSTYEGGAAGLGNREVEKLLRAGRL